MEKILNRTSEHREKNMKLIVILFAVAVVWAAFLVDEAQSKGGEALLHADKTLFDDCQHLEVGKPDGPPVEIKPCKVKEDSKGEYITYGREESPLLPKNSGGSIKTNLDSEAGLCDPKSDCKKDSIIEE